jgi:NAD(P)H-flavin reductase
MYLFYGCRRSNEDFLYKNEWPAYEAELDGKFIMRTAFSREMTKPDGGKVYVQDQLWDEKDKIAPLILDKRAYVYICGDAHSMSKAVEAALSKMLGESKGGDSEAGAKELKLLKDRNVSLLVQKHRPELTSTEAQDGCLELGCRDKGSLRFSSIHNNICIQFKSTSIQHY